MKFSTICGLLALLVAGPAFGATCKISEYSQLVRDDRGNLVSVALEPPLTTQNVTYTTSTASSAFNASTRFIRVVCDAKAHFVFVTDTTNATASDPYLPADTPEYFGLPNDPENYTVEFYDGTS